MFEGQQTDFDDRYKTVDAENHVWPPQVPMRQRPRIPILLLAICVLLSGMFGFVGGYLAGQIGPGQKAVSEGFSLLPEVLNKTEPRLLTSSRDVISATEELSVVEAVAWVKPTVVEITTETVAMGGRMGQFVREGAGSGVIISSDGYIVTNNHVVSGARSITVRLVSGAEHTAQLVGRDTKTDLAVIKIQATGLTAAVSGDSAGLQVGETMIAVGNPLGELGGTVTSGILSALDRTITIDGQSMRLLQTDAAVNPGNSGGGLFNMKAELIGIVNAKSSGTDVEGLGFAIPINTAKSVVESIIENGYVRGRVDAGLTLVEILDAQTALAYRVSRTGLYVYGATNRDFRSGDRIVSVDGVEVVDLVSYEALMDTYAVGDTVRIVVSRRERLLTLDVVLTELQD